MFSPLFVCLCLFVSEQDISKSYGRNRTKLGGQVRYATMTNRLDFGEDLDLDTRMF